MDILQRIEGSRMSYVVRRWKNESVAIFGCGPSLTQDQVDEAAHLRCIAVNDAFLLAPWADVHYAADAKWHTWMRMGIDKPSLGLTAAYVARCWQAFAGQKCSIDSSRNGVADDVHLLGNRDIDVHGYGLSADSRYIATGRNSGAQALNIAVLAGAKEIRLYGFDGQPAADGTTHFHGGHPKASNHKAWAYIRESFVAMRKPLQELGVKVWNCSPGSAIDAFPRA